MEYSVQKATNEIAGLFQEHFEKQDLKSDRDYRTGFNDGWNAGVTGNESLLAKVNLTYGYK